ncbi:hypothetical protein BBP40_006442 [Aspergillus hancockii]|nr:hypothetical protein BBP40_006442 [Aspergillus hancockii]
MAPSGPLFQGKQFWLSQNIPQRSRFKETIQNHGGIIRLHEKDADIKLVDHARKNLPPDTYSYRYVEWSIRNGKLEDLEKHRAGPSAARPVGATNIPTRSHKLPYTLEDDQFLWDWMSPYEEDSNAPIQGNRIYQELAAQNRRHPYQSWRDRYLKRLRGRPRPGGMPKQYNSASPTQEGLRKSPGREKPEPQRKQSHNGHAAVDELYERKRKRTPDHNNPDRGMNGVASQKRRAIDKTLLDSTHAVLNAQQSKSPNHQNTPTPASPAMKETHIIGDPNTDTLGAAESENPLNHDLDNTIDPFFLELPFLPSSPNSEPEEPPSQDIQTWIDTRLRTGRAENEAQIIAALRCTSMDSYLADKVLDYLTAGKDIPNDIPGVWTAEDDRCIEADQTRPIKRVLEKHGSESFNARWKYLEMARAAGLDGTES